MADGERMTPTPQPGTEGGRFCTSWPILRPEAPPEANESCIVSLGICPVCMLTWPDLHTDLPASDRDRPLSTWANGTLMAHCGYRLEAVQHQLGRLRLHGLSLA